MGSINKRWSKSEQWAQKRGKAIWANLHTNNLWKRMFKNTVATTAAVIIALDPDIVRIYGPAAYLLPITTVFGHPGRRFGMMFEALVLATCGTLLGLGWSLLGVYLSSLIIQQNAPAAYTIRGVFLGLALIFHGFVRSSTPRLFILTVLEIIVSVVSLTGTSRAVSKSSATVILYPILTAVALIILVNIIVFPEFSSSFLGTTTIETLGETVDTLRDAGKYFVSVVENQPKAEDEPIPRDDADGSNNTKERVNPKKSAIREPLFKRGFHMLSSSKASKNSGNEAMRKVTLKSLTDRKAKLRAKLGGCKAAQQECNFELAYAVLPPELLKPISVTAMTSLVANTIALIGACESKYALMGDEDDNIKADVTDAAKAAGLETDSPTSGPSTDVNVANDDSSQGKRWTRKDVKNNERPKKDVEDKKREESKSKKRRNTLQQDIENLELIKPKKEIEFGDVELLRHLVDRITSPLRELQSNIDASVGVVTSCLAYSYDVPKLPFGAPTPGGIQLQEIDIRVDVLTDALTQFDKDSAEALESAAAISHLEHLQVDVMPRMETFLISSFLLNLRQAGLHTLEMLRHSRIVLEKRQSRHNWRRLYAPQINWRKWLASGGEEDMLVLPDNARKDIRTGKMDSIDQEDSSFTRSEDGLLRKKDLESSVPPETTLQRDTSVPTSRAKAQKLTHEPKKKKSFTSRLRNGLADLLEYLSDSDDVVYAIKLAVAVYLVTWPAFVASWNTWYSLNRGLWAALQLVLITEVAIGTSVMTFLLRAFGTSLGCLWGYAAYQAKNGNHVVLVVILVIGIIPSTYIQLGSKYVKAGMVSIISMCIVCLATTSRTVPGTATENFLKRFIAFLIGGIVALLVQFTFVPVKARDRLVESLAASITQIIQMEACLAHGVESGENVDVHSAAITERFDHAKTKARGALAAADTFLPFCANEPRLKGSFKGLALVYAEISYVLHAIVDRMDNMIHLRYEYGSGVLEELNSQVFAYRRNVAGAITIVLFAVHEALTTKLPLPQFLPSPRLAHLRMVNRVREVVFEKELPLSGNEEDASQPGIETSMVKRVIRQKFLSWNAASAGQIEVIEFLEELIDLAKLLVGANEFRNGMLTRPTYREYIERMDKSEQSFQGRTYGPRGPEESAEENEDIDREEALDRVPEPVVQQTSTTLKKRSTFSRKTSAGDLKKSSTEDEKLERQKQANGEELPRSLQRVRSRRIEEMNLQRYRSNESGKGKSKPS
jgi:hypothetical protein